MVSPVAQDLFTLSRDVARAVGALSRWRSELEADSQVDGHRAEGEDPFDGLRHVAARSTVQALAELSPSGVDVPLRHALMRWVSALVQERIALEDDAARARAMSAPSGRFEGEPPRRVTWRQAWRGLVGARTAAEVHLWLAAAADCATPLAVANRARAARRVEVARRLGHKDPWEPLIDVPRGTLRASAQRLLDATEDVSRAVWKEALGGADSPGARLCLAVGRDAGEGWPARLTAAWFDEAFGGGPRGLPIEMGALPHPTGAASFARALAVFGFAARLAAAPSSLPFALARDPAFVGAHRLALVFGSLPTDVVFHRKALGLGRRTAVAQSRVLVRTALLDARLSAARILLGDEVAFSPKELFAELGMRLFGKPLDPRLAAAWPAARDDEPARWVALLEARPLRDALREQFDSDWFRNPHAWSHLRGEGSVAAREPVSPDGLESAAGALARAFEEALG
jgi:hypothetical protein